MSTKKDIIGSRYLKAGLEEVLDSIEALDQAALNSNARVAQALLEIKSNLLEEAKAIESILKISKGSRYKNPDGTFKKMTCPDNPDHESKFCGCVRWAMSDEGGNRSQERAEGLCAYLYRRKKGK